MTSFLKMIRESIVAGLKKGGKSFLWVMKILIPISFGTVLLVYFGMLNHIEGLLAPMMGFLSLPPYAALPLVVGLLTGIYGAVGAMAVLPLTEPEMALIAVFLLISHNLIQESLIQGNSGYHSIKAGLIRLMTSIITVKIIAVFFISEAVTKQEAFRRATSPAGFSAMIYKWGLEMISLSVQIFLIVTCIMIVIDIMKRFNLIKKILGLLKPMLRLMGLRPDVGILWLSANLFGLVYGAAVIVEEYKQGYLKRDELNPLHLSIGINHSMVEDPSLFLPLGISPFWLWVPRFVVAVIMVHLVNLWHKIRRSGVGISDGVGDTET